MRFLIVFAVVCSLAIAQLHRGTERPVGYDIEDFVRDNPSITVAECTAKCDAIFALDAPQDDTIEDRDCVMECRFLIEGPPTGEPPSGEPPSGPGDR